MFVAEPILLTVTQPGVGTAFRQPFPAHRLLLIHGFNTATGSSQNAFLKYYIGDKDSAVDEPDVFFSLPPSGLMVIPLGIVLPAGYGLTSNVLVGETPPNSDVHLGLIWLPFA